jgi:hypothetical protein
LAVSRLLRILRMRKKSMGSIRYMVSDDTSTSWSYVERKSLFGIDLSLIKELWNRSHFVACDRTGPNM